METAAVSRGRTFGTILSKLPLRDGNGPALVPNTSIAFAFETSSEGWKRWNFTHSVPTGLLSKLPLRDGNPARLLAARRRQCPFRNFL